MAAYSDYYSTIFHAISRLPSKTEEARGAVYELARTALQKRLSAFDPPMSETDLEVERFALETAIQRVETESRSSDTRHDLSFISTVMQMVHSVGNKINNHIAIKADGLKAAIGAGLAQRLEFIQRTPLTATCQHYLNIFGKRQWITKYPQTRIAIRLLVAALAGIFGGMFTHWMTG